MGHITKEARQAYRLKNRDRILAGKKVWRQSPNGRESLRKARLMYQFGISAAEYDARLKAQAGVCALCGEPETMTRRGKVRLLCVDHCHDTGKVRGLLCARCNLAVGLIGDDPEWAGKLAAYLNPSN